MATKKNGSQGRSRRAKGVIWEDHTLIVICPLNFTIGNCGYLIGL